MWVGENGLTEGGGREVGRVGVAPFKPPNYGVDNPGTLVGMPTPVQAGQNQGWACGLKDQTLVSGA